MQSIRRQHPVHGDSAKILLPSFSLMEKIFPVFMQNLHCIISECIRLLSEEKLQLCESHLQTKIIIIPFSFKQLNHWKVLVS